MPEDAKQHYKGKLPERLCPMLNSYFTVILLFTSMLSGNKEEGLMVNALVPNWQDSSRILVVPSSTG